MRFDITTTKFPAETLSPLVGLMQGELAQHHNSALLSIAWEGSYAMRDESIFASRVSVQNLLVHEDFAFSLTCNLVVCIGYCE